MKCAFCGRRLDSKTRGTVCNPCRRVQGQAPPGPEHELTGGTWVTVRGIQRWVEHVAQPPCGRPVIALRLSEEARREAHRLWTQGRRDPAVVAGEREYKRALKRYERARRKDAAA